MVMGLRGRSSFTLLVIVLLSLAGWLSPAFASIEASPHGVFVWNSSGKRPVAPDGNAVVEDCSASKPCKPGVVLGVWEPVEVPECTRWFRAFVYLISLLYLFLGVSIVSDRFMTAIEVITSQERAVKVKTANGGSSTVLIRVWNETVSNLTLMALGSSAPEILLSVIEIFGNNFEAGDLGPSTIVGSAAFNLFVIIAICIYVIPTPEIRRVHRIDVFWVTAAWGTFAYVWLFLILAVISPNVVEVWEGVVTFLCFPLTVLTAYAANRYTKDFGQRILGAGSFLRRNTQRTFRSSPKHEVTLEKGSEDFVNSLIDKNHKEDAVAFDDHRKRYIEVFRKIRNENPDLTIDDVEKLAASELVKEAPKSRAFYRIQATHKMMAAGDLNAKNEKRLRKKSKEIMSEMMPEKPKQVAVQFEPANYMCLESIGVLKVTVKCDRGSLEVPTRVSVHYRTVADTAQEDDDFIPVEGDLIFKPGEDTKVIEIGIVDNDVFEEDEQFHVQLSDVKAVCDTNELQTIKAVLGNDPLATVLIIDDDHGGAFSFDHEVYKVPESSGVFNLELKRHRGARGRVRIPYTVTDGTAENGKDYVAEDGELVFEDGETITRLEIEIINDDEYEKSEDFYIELGQPVWETDIGPGENGADGRPILGAHTRCKVIIIEDKEFQNFVDKFVANANLSLMVGTSSWRQQFVDAMEVEDIDGDGSLSVKEKILHYIALPWKLLFASIPPTDYYNGWVCFVISIVFIGLLTAVIGDVASMLGCTVGIKDSVTAITLVAMGTSLPDTFASKMAAVQDPTADASIGNVTGSNAVNVFLGIGVAWAIAAIVHASRGTVFRVNSAGLASSVTLFLIGSIVCFGVLSYRRANKNIRAELGGPTRSKTISAIIFFCVWITYIVYSTCTAYCLV
uniref:Sodium/calcium exchanger 1 n=1 Tax=Panagrellus redivivus TaxID=6233 RepID=A0A7E4UWF2_PANRE